MAVRAPEAVGPEQCRGPVHGAFDVAGHRLSHSRKDGGVLVQPSQKTFSSFVIADHEFNFDERREGWPSELAFIPNGTLKVDTLRARSPGSDVIRHEPTRVYWILKMGHTLPMFPQSAFGRLAIADAPAGEGGIARWIGPTEALTSMAHRGAVVDERWVELTSIVPLEPGVPRVTQGTAARWRAMPRGE